MTFFKFGPNDIFVNRIKAYPDIKFLVNDGNIYYNNQLSGNNSPTGHIDLYELDNNNSSVKPYPFITKNGSLLSFKTVSTSQFNQDFNYGDTVTGSYPFTSSISTERYVAGQSRPRIDALRNTLNFYKPLNPHYAYTSSFGNKGSQELRLISVPSIFFGSSIRKGSVSLKFYVSGTLAAELIDDKKNGSLRQSLPEDSYSGSVGGVVLYNEGFIILTGSWDIHPTHTEKYNVNDPGTNYSPNWIYFSTTGSTTPADGTNVPSSSFEIEFEGTQQIPVITMFAHAPKSELNFSSNPTFIQHGQTGTLTPLTSSTRFKEHSNIAIKNVVKSNFSEPTGSFRKETYISSIGLYDGDMNLIGRAKLARPKRKRESDGFTFKLKLDI